MKHDHPTYGGFEVGDITNDRCEFCNAAMAFHHTNSEGYILHCVVDPSLDHARHLVPQDLSG